MVQQQTQQVDFSQLMGELANRIRVLESKQSLFTEKLLIMNQNMLEEHKKVVEKMKKLNGVISAVNEEMDSMKNIMRHLTDEAAGFAKEDDLKVLEKYINVWNPLNFVSEKEVKRIVQGEIKDARPATTSE
tara:strand:+ start:364 stop:756 length:393 start_codon:yes stop_codon:yes gene_type:complete